MKELFALAFKSDLSLAQMFDRLNAAGPWQWIQRDSERFGDYLSTRDLPGYSVVKIIEESDHFVANTRFESEEPNADAELTALRETLVGRVLPSIGARDVTETDTY